MLPIYAMARGNGLVHVDLWSVYDIEGYAMPMQIAQARIVVSLWIQQGEP